jgi:glycosyltransferase involved in cell wall biosynthesis
MLIKQNYDPIKKKNIFEFAYNWPAETFIQRHLKALREYGVNVRLFARNGNAVHVSGASIAHNGGGLPSEVMPNFDYLSTLQKILNLRFLHFSHPELSVRDQVLLGYFEHLRPDLIHFHDASLAASMYWIPVALGIPYTLSLRGSDIQVLTLQSTTQRDATISAIEGAAKIHAVCYALGLTAAQLLGRALDASVIYTTLPIPPVLPAWQRVTSEGQIHFVSSGRFMWRKGFPDILVALRHLRDRGMDARLTIIGVGPELDHLLYLRKMLSLEAAVDLPGKLTYEQILDLFLHAHAYVQSSVAEGLSNSLAEAMANGLPVFATDVDGTCEVVQDGVSGFLLPPLAPQDWAEKLMQVRDAALMERVRVNAYEKAGQFFSAEGHARAFISFFKEVI